MFLGNEGILAKHGSVKVLFDAFFSNPIKPEVNVPEDMRKAMFEGGPPFDGISVVFVTHLHGDHYNGPDLVRYLSVHPDAKLVAPKQVVERLKEKEHPAQKMLLRVVPITATEGGPPQRFNIGAVKIEAFHVIHLPIGRPGPMENIIYRVQIGNGVTIMHFGDADINPESYSGQLAAWQARRSDIAFAPFWFFGVDPDGVGPIIDVKKQLNVDRLVGFHAWNSTLQDIDRLEKRDQFILKPGETIKLAPSRQ
jgi:L-ascorbate metabolism protein UlaG (beta-lactamase superfamily)